MSGVLATGGTSMPPDQPPSYENSAAPPSYDYVNQGTAPATAPPTAPPMNNTYQPQYQPQPPMQQQYQPQPPMQQNYQPQPPMQQNYQPQPMQQQYKPETNTDENGPKKYFGCRIGVWVLIGLLAWVTIFEFCALCVSNKLTTVKNSSITIHCGWEGYQAEFGGSSSTTKYKDCSDDNPCKDNKNAGNTFIAFGILSFFLILGMFPTIVSIDLGFLPCCCNIWTANLVCSGILWLFMTISWGAWVDQNTCKDADDSKHGGGLNLMITAWFFFTFSYIPLSIPAVQKMCFGPQACDD